MRHHRFITAAAVALVVPLGMLAFAEDEVQPPTPEDLAWMAGTWRSEGGGFEFEEHWTAPWGGGLCAVSRGVQGGKTTLVELSEITTKDGAMVLRLRHFNPGLKPWDSEKDGPLEWTLSESGKNKVVFSNAAKDFPRSVTYERKGDVLHATLDGEEDGKPQRMAFELPLVK